jgi:ankyrin repeat protein
VKHFVVNELYSSEDFDETAVALAARYGHLHIVKYLVRKGFKLSNLALELAASDGHLRVIKYLVRKGLDVRANKSMSLHRAVAVCSVGCVKYLFDNGANLYGNITFEFIDYLEDNMHIPAAEYLLNKLGELGPEDTIDGLDLQNLFQEQ